MKGNKKKVSKVLLSSTLLLTMFFTTMPTSVFAAENVASPNAGEKGIDIYKKFSDANFINYIEDTPPLEVGKPKINIDTDGNKFLSQEEINNTKGIAVYDKEIKDLKGIECFTELTVLNCNNNQLTSLDVSQNVKLTNLSCSNNLLKSLNISSNRGLIELECDDNSLTSLDISNNTSLTGLWCRGNKLTGLDVSNNTALKNLICSGNQLTSLNLSSEMRVTYLNCSPQNSTILYDKNKGYLLSAYDKGFVKDKATNFVGANYKDGTLTGVTFGKDITYDYDTGYAGTGAKLMNVTLTFVEATDATKLEDAKTLADNAIKTISATNETTNKIILDAVTKNISSVKGVSAAWKAGSPTITLATKDTAGSIKGTIVLTSGSKTMEVTVDKLIEKLTTATPDKPTITVGSGSNHQVNSSNDMAFTCSGKLEDLNGVYVDGKLVAESNYTLKSGSTILTLKSSYLDTLSVGKHILKFQYKDNVAAETNFTITTKTDETPAKPSTPNTGDTSNTMLCFGLMVLSGCLAGYSLKKKKALRS